VDGTEGLAEELNKGHALIRPPGKATDMDNLAASKSLNSADFVDQARDFHWDPNKLEAGIAVALSGGGFRAMLFHAGALARFNEFGLLSKAARISSVSGGSIAAGYLAKIWSTFGPAGAGGVLAEFKAGFVDKVLEFSQQNLDVADAVWGLLPFHTVAEEVAASYDKFLFDGLTLQNLPDSPRFVFCATNMQTGVLWRFSKPYAGDYIVGRIDKPDIKLSLAVAASAAFPPFLSPLALTLPASDFKSWPDPTGSAPDPKPFRDKVLLVDGGVYDNHGLEPIVKRYMTLFVSDGGAPFARMSDVRTDWLSQLRRVLDLEDNQSRALRRRDLMMRLTKGNVAFASATPPKEGFIDDVARMGAYWGIDTDAARVAPADALPCNREIVQYVAAVSTRLSDPGDLTARRLINWGYAICDRCLRAHYHGPVKPLQSKAEWPYPAAAIG
jgi:NTE family protein